MSINKPQKYNISGRKFKGKLEQKWETTLARKYLPYHEDKKDKIDFTTDFTFVIHKLMVNFDVTAIDAKKHRPIVIDDTGDSIDHLFGIEEYLFDQEEIERLENEDHRLIIECIIDSGIINDAYKERDPQEVRKRLKRRIENITTILNREGLRTREKIFLNQKKDEFEKELKRLRKLLPAKKKLREDQEDKKEVQDIAKSLWYEEELKIRIKKMSNQRAIKRIVGKRYKPKTVHKWLSEVAPKFAKQPGRPKGREQT